MKSLRLCATIGAHNDFAKRNKSAISTPNTKTKIRMGIVNRCSEIHPGKCIATKSSDEIAIAAFRDIQSHNF